MHGDKDVVDRNRPLNVLPNGIACDGKLDPDRLNCPSNFLIKLDIPESDASSYTIRVLERNRTMDAFRIGFLIAMSISASMPAAPEVTRGASWSPTDDSQAGSADRDKTGTCGTQKPGIFRNAGLLC